MKKKVAFIVQRYGEEVAGGSEYYVRLVAEQMKEKWDIEILTTCANDYTSWENKEPPGSVLSNGILVKRFLVDFPRLPVLFQSLPMDPYGAYQFEETRWVREQGPFSSPCLDYLSQHHQDYEALFFFTYLYGLTAFGISIAPEKSILIPTAHDEQPIYLSYYEKVFTQPAGLLFLTPEEEHFVKQRFSITKPTLVAGVGISEPPSENLQTPITESYLLYLGRLDPSKGVWELMDYFQRFKQRHPKNPLKLILAGKKVMHLPKHPDCLEWGFVDEATKWKLLKHAQALVMPSPFESLSMVVLEAWAAQKAVLVSGKSEVLKGHCQRSDGGFVYTDAESFCQSLEKIYVDEPERHAMGVRGKAYVDRYYQWPYVTDIYERALREWIP